jgi:hypothetical protein
MTKPNIDPDDFTGEDLGLTLTSVADVYGITLVPVERVAQAMIELNGKLAKEMRTAKTRYTTHDLDRKYQALLHELETTGACTRGEDKPPTVSRDRWLQAQLNMIESLSRDDRLWASSH